MKSLILKLLFLASFLVSVPCLARSQSIYGAYQDCPFHCRTIKINADRTFEYRLNGDLYNDQRYEGTWRFVGRNKIKATSPVDHSPLRVSERLGNQPNYYTLLVVAPNGAVVSGVTISGIANHKRFIVATNEDGTAQIPICRRFRISFRDYWGKHAIRNLSARQFIIELSVEQMTNDAIDETWLIEDRRLYVAGRDGSFDKGHWLDKLSNEEARKIFH